MQSSVLSRKDAFDFLTGVRLGVIATNARAGAPEAAVVNLAVTPDLELVFETIQTTRKCVNLRNDPRVTIVAWRDERTLQYEGVADEPDEYARKPLLDIYFAAQTDALGHCGWPGLTYVRVKPRWLRLSRYGTTFEIRELRFPD